VLLVFEKLKPHAEGLAELDLCLAITPSVLRPKLKIEDAEQFDAVPLEEEQGQRSQQEGAYSPSKFDSALRRVKFRDEVTIELYIAHLHSYGLQVMNV